MSHSCIQKLAPYPIQQMDKRNKPDTYLTKWWIPKTTIDQGIAKVFNEMKGNYDNIV